MTKNKTQSTGTFKATLLDAFAKAHVMIVDERVIKQCETSHGIDNAVLLNTESPQHWYYTTLPSNHVYTFKDGKTTFTDSDGDLRTVEVFSLVPMTSLEDQ